MFETKSDECVLLNSSTTEKVFVPEGKVPEAEANEIKTVDETRHTCDDDAETYKGASNDDNTDATADDDSSNDVFESDLANIVLCENFIN